MTLTFHRRIQVCVTRVVSWAVRHYPYRAASESRRCLIPRSCHPSIHLSSVLRERRVCVRRNSNDHNEDVRFEGDARRKRGKSLGVNAKDDMEEKGRLTFVES